MFITLRGVGIGLIPFIENSITARDIVSLQNILYPLFQNKMEYYCINFKFFEVQIIFENLILLTFITI